MNYEVLNQTLYSGAWGTIGPHFGKSAEAICKKCGGSFAVVMHSNTAAYETALRSLGICHGDKVLCAAYSDKMDGEVAAAIGAIPVFADIDKDTLSLSADGICAALAREGEVKAVVVDYTKDTDVDAIKKVCADNNCALIINADDALDAKFDFDGIYAVIFNYGLCGAAVTGTEQNYIALFAWHHCGHAPGTAASISFESIVGGDMRVSEFQAIQIYDLLEKGNPVSEVSARGYIAAYDNAAFKTDYFRKMTGFAGEYDAALYPNAAAAVK